MLAPKGYTQHIDENAYVAARVTASKTTGVLRLRTAMTVLSAALILFGGQQIYESGGRPFYVIAGAAVMLAAAALVLLWYWLLPKYIKETAKIAFVTFDKLSNDAEVSFEQDKMTLQGRMLTRHVAFAKTRLCAETPDRFVVITDDGTVVILEKDAFAEREQTDAFLRDVFARWYKKAK